MYIILTNWFFRKILKFLGSQIALNRLSSDFVLTFKNHVAV